MTDELALQNLWLALQKKSWRVLAVVAATPNGASLDVANALVDLAREEAGEDAAVLDLREVKLRHVEPEKARIAEHRGKNARLVIALASPDRSAASLALARAADAAVVVVRVGETPMKTAARAADEIGRDKVLGAVLVTAKPVAKPAPVPAPARAPKKSAPPPSVPPSRPALVPAAVAATVTQPLRPAAAPAAAAVGKATVKIVSGGAKT